MVCSSAPDIDAIRRTSASLKWSHGKSRDAERAAALLGLAREWLARETRKPVSMFTTNDVAIAQFILFDALNLSDPFANPPMASWRSAAGELVPDVTARRPHEPFVAIALCVSKSTMRVHVQWAPGSGFGYVVNLGRPSSQTFPRA